MLEAVLRGIFSAVFLSSVLRISTPSDPTCPGRFDIRSLWGDQHRLEGGMLVAAFTGVMVSGYTHNLGVWGFGRYIG